MTYIPQKYYRADPSELPPQIVVLLENLRDKSNHKRGLYIHGGVGVGKTHMLYAIAKYLQDKGASVLVENAVDLLYEIKKDFDQRPENKRQPLEWILQDDRLLLLDDLGSEKSTEWAQETFYQIINRRYMANRTIIITSNCPMQELAERVGDRTASRIMEMCNIVEVSGVDRRMNNANKISIKL